MAVGQLANQPVLRSVRVLVLIDHDVAEPGGVPGPRVLGCVEQLNGLEQEVVEIQRGTLREGLRIAFVHRRNHLVTMAPAFFLEAVLVPASGSSPG